MMPYCVQKYGGTEYIMTFVKRRDAREAVLCILFDYSFQPEESPEELLDMYVKYYCGKTEEDIANESKDNEDTYFPDVFLGVIANLEKIDEIIEKCAEKWSKKRISRISMSVLRIAIYEMLYCKEIPVQVSINEAVELAKKYDTDDSYTFVHGVLGAADKIINASTDDAK